MGSKRLQTVSPSERNQRQSTTVTFDGQELPPAVFLYLDVMKKVLTRSLAPERYVEREVPNSLIKRLIFKALRKQLESRGVQMMRQILFDREKRENGRDSPSEADTMIGLKRLDNVQECALNVIRNGVPGDFIETGVWRGGTTIFMRAILAACDCRDRSVWVADSFRGLPTPNAEKYPADQGDTFWTNPELVISIDNVQDNFDKYGLLDEQVKFLKGWFKDTLPTAPIDALALMRLDGDLYESTMDALTALYPKLSVGGYVIVDDYGALPEQCAGAVHDYRDEHGIGEPIHEIDWTGVYWQKLE